MQPATPRRIPVHSQAYGTVSLFCGSIPGLFLALRSHPDAASRSKAHSVCWNPTKADRGRHCMSAAWSQESQFQEEPWVLLVHSPLLQQSRLLAVPPLSDMLKFGGSFHVRQVTGPRWSAQESSHQSFADHWVEAVGFPMKVQSHAAMLLSAINCLRAGLSDIRLINEPIRHRQWLRALVEPCTTTTGHHTGRDSLSH